MWAAMVIKHPQKLLWPLRRHIDDDGCRVRIFLTINLIDSINPPGVSNCIINIATLFGRFINRIYNKLAVGGLMIPSTSMVRWRLVLGFSLNNKDGRKIKKKRILKPYISSRFTSLKINSPKVRECQILTLIRSSRGSYHPDRFAYIGPRYQIGHKRDRDG